MGAVVIIDNYIVVILWLYYMYLYVLFTLFNSYGWHNGNWTHFSTNHQTELGQMYWGQMGKIPEVLDVNFVPGNADVSQPETIVGILWGYYDIKPTM